MSLHFIEQMSPILSTPDEATWFGAVTGLAEDWGFDQILLGILPRPSLPIEDAFIRSTYAPSWRTAYDERKFASIDPIVAHCVSHSSPIVWTPELFAGTPQQSMMYEEARSHGLRAGVSLPIHGPKQQWGMLCFASDANPNPNGEFWQQVNAVLPNLVLLRDLVIDTSQRHLNTHSRPLIPQLTPRERECLMWTAQGKSTWEISHILNCSEAVVNFHVKNIRAKFGVTSRRAAAVIATQLGLIDPG